MAEPARKENKKTVHWHGCRQCSAPYEDNCQATGEDGVCVICRGGHGFPILIENRKPRDCCRQLARLVTKDEKKTYRLAGMRIWFICRACARIQPFDPRREKRTT